MVGIQELQFFDVSIVRDWMGIKTIYRKKIRRRFLTRYLGNFRVRQMKAFKGIMGLLGRDLEVSKIEMDTRFNIQSNIPNGY